MLPGNTDERYEEVSDMPMPETIYKVYKIKAIIGCNN